LQQHPLPSLKNNNVYLDRTPLDFASKLSVLDDFGLGSPAVVTEYKPKSDKQFKNKKDKLPSKENSREQRRRNNKAREEKDDCRPDSDRHAFNSLQASKHRARLASIPTPFGHNHFDMAGKVLRIPKKPPKAAPAGASNEENVVQNRQILPSSKRNSSTNEEIQLADATEEAVKIGMIETLTTEERNVFEQRLKVQLEKDAKLSKDKRSDALKKLRRAYLILLTNNERLLVYKSKVDQVQAQLDEAHRLANARITKRKAHLLRENEDEKEKIDKLVTTELWRTCKFINCKDDEDQASEFLYKLIYSEKQVNLDSMYSWIETYKNHIKKALYSKRNYATSQIKLSAWNLFENGKPLPTVAMILKCVSRTIDVNDAEEMAVFQWYWEVLLPKMVGAAEWGNTVRYYTTIYNARLPNDDRNRKLVTASHEGMLLAIWDNNFDNWHELYEWSKQPENRALKQKNKGGKFTSTNKGQRQFGGWEPHGIEAYNRYCEAAAVGRKAPNRKLLEKNTLKSLRTKYNIDQPDHDSQARVNRNRKRKKLSPDEAPYAPPMVRIVRTKMLEDEGDSTEEEDD
jgi:hypothetical protein